MPLSLHKYTNTKIHRYTNTQIQHIWENGCTDKCSMNKTASVSVVTKCSLPKPGVEPDFVCQRFWISGISAQLNILRCSFILAHSVWNNGGVIISSCVRAGTRAPLYWGANKQTAELRRNPMQAKWTQPLKFGKYARGNEICGNYLEIAAKYALVGKPSASACIVQDNKLIIVKKRKGDEGLWEGEGGSVSNLCSPTHPFSPPGALRSS